MSFDHLPRRLILVTSFLGSMTLSFAVNTPALCLTAISGEFGMDKAASGFFLSCAFWGLLVGMLATGPLADRWGIRALLVASAFLQGGGLFLTGLAASAWMVFLWAFVIGLGTETLDEWGDPHARPVLDELLGIRSRRRGDGSPTLELLSGQDRWVTYAGHCVVADPTPDVQLLSHVVERTTSSWDGIENGSGPARRSPGMWIRRVGKGAVVWAAVKLFGSYLDAPTPQQRRWFRSVITSLVSPKVTLEGPLFVTVNTRIRQDGTWMIHLHNAPGTAYAYPTPMTGHYTHAPGEVVPVHDLVIRLNGPVALEATPGLTKTAFAVEDGGQSIKVPRLERHDVVIVRMKV